MNDTLGGIVEGDIGRWQNSPHGVVVAPDGNVWVNIYAGSGRQEILAMETQFTSKVFTCLIRLPVIMLVTLQLRY